MERGRIIFFAIIAALCCGLADGFLFDRRRSRPCTYGKWSKCNTTDLTGAIRTRMPTVDRRQDCIPQRERCRIGSILGNAFIDNLLQPVSAPSGQPTFPDVASDGKVNKPVPGIQTHSRRGFSFGRRRRRRSSSVRRPTPTTIPPQVNSAQSNCVDVRDPMTNEPLMGNCNTQQQRGAARRSKRSLHPVTPAVSVPTVSAPTVSVPTVSVPTHEAGKVKCVEARDPFSNQVILGRCAEEDSEGPAGRRRRSVDDNPDPEALISPSTAPPDPQRNRDLLIMMDESGSVGEARFMKVKRIAAAIVKVLCDNIRVHRDKTRVSVMSFDSTHHYHIRLNQYFDKIEDLTSRIKNIRYSQATSSRTCLNSALQFAMDTALSSALGGRGQDRGVEQDIILLTDGCANCASSTLQATSNSLIRRGINVYVIGIGLRGHCKNNLKILAQGGRCFHYFYLSRWDYDVDSFIETLENPPDGACLLEWGDADSNCAV